MRTHGNLSKHSALTDRVARLDARVDKSRNESTPRPVLFITSHPNNKPPTPSRDFSAKKKPPLGGFFDRFFFDRFNGALIGSLSIALRNPGGDRSASVLSDLTG